MDIDRYTVLGFMAVVVAPILAVTTVVSAMTNDGPSKTKERPIVVQTAAPVAVVSTAPVKSNWNYGENVDKMSGEVTKWAMSDSLNKVSMKFPYNGGSEGTIVVFEKNVKIHISKGQVMCSNYSGCTIRVKFDDEQAVDYAAVGPNNGQHSHVYLGVDDITGNGAKRFMDKLKTAKKVMISMEVFQENRPVWEFNVAGLTQ